MGEDTGMTPAHERHHDVISQAVVAIQSPAGGLYTNELAEATGLHREIITNWLKAHNYLKTGGHMSKHWQRREA